MLRRLVYATLLALCLTACNDAAPTTNPPDADLATLILELSPPSARLTITGLASNTVVDLNDALVSETVLDTTATRTFSLEADTFEVSVKQAGYRAFSQVVTLQAGSEVRVVALLELLPPGQVAPVAAFTLTPSTGTAPLTLNADASASRDADGDIVRYVWDFGNGVTAEGVRAEPRYETAGNFVVALSVTDSDGLTDTHSRGVSINARPTAAFTEIPNPDNGLEVSFDASASSDVDGTLQSYAWTFGDGAQQQGEVVTHTFAGPGIYEVSLTVTDDDGATATSKRSLSVDAEGGAGGGVTMLEPLSVSADGRNFISGSKPFFWLSDTLWLLFSNTTEADVTKALDSAEAKGFTVVQTFVVAAFSNFGKPGRNTFGEFPFIDNNPAKLNPAYFDYVAWVIEEAAKRGLYVAVTFGEPARTGEDIPYEVTSRENAYAYAYALGSRFRTQTLANQIIWMNGHDRNPDRNLGEDVWLALSEGLADGVNDVNQLDGVADYSTVLMSYHTDGGFEGHGWSSSDFFHNAAWLDFNAVNTYKNYDDLVGILSSDYALFPTKPTVCYEPSYEGDDFVGFGLITAWEVRFQGYWCALSGGAGYTYGHTDGYKLTKTSAWPAFLESEGRADMLHLKAALTSKPLVARVPDQSLVISDTGEPDFDKDYVVAARAQDGSYAFVYSTNGRDFSLDLTKLPGASFSASWFDPRTGAYSSLGTVASSAAQSFNPPGEPGEGNDWLLVVEAQP